MLDEPAVSQSVKPFALNPYRLSALKAFHAPEGPNVHLDHPSVSRKC